ncbi:glycoside hydrolase family 32 protein [Spirosoma sp. KCTC 42546]|uniref:glycoside hydrolase family 32 protein n=1 Tax=Spirosoma sp. KCTC 42546 TaxID=2520506 RepID=UPI0011572981|nr:glycoside hydrolase family 32 protein [Spirosoma sp. KCTC 42546]QDK81337.1 glycoside hydrolase family 32 protein [Spirosoma sp. KCTC 42546]
MHKLLAGVILLLHLGFDSVGQQTRATTNAEPHRPQYHFTPKAHWMNDPNGMVYYKGTYHLFFQYYPDATVWGPMHWGHATSKDMVHWQEQPIALYPDSLGYIFSGSAVVDVNNTSGFGKNGQIPLVAIFTHHDPKGEKQKSDRFQYQSLAYSLDEGKTWTKYAGNPVLPNPGITDFRDPKVRWFAPQKKWVMTLATKDRVTFYSSPNLKTWTKESEFGHDLGAHGGVWECPDLFPLDHNGKKTWVLLVSINPGGPNGGSATQYFVGDFDGSTFKPYSKDTKWMDFGADNYAGVTFANTGDRTILMGWMSNWQYATVVPTSSWRSANTVPRELGLNEVNKELFLTSKPVNELDALSGQRFVLKNQTVKGQYDLTAKTKNETGLFKLDLSTQNTNDFSIVLTNEQGNELTIGYDKGANVYYIDRSHSGKTDFEKGFGKRHTAPRLSSASKVSLTLLADVASVELFADSGLTVMTDIFFSDKELNKLSIKSTKGISLTNLIYTKLNSSGKSGL